MPTALFPDAQGRMVFPREVNYENLLLRFIHATIPPPGKCACAWIDDSKRFCFHWFHLKTFPFVAVHPKNVCAISRCACVRVLGRGAAFHCTSFAFSFSPGQNRKSSDWTSIARCGPPLSSSPRTWAALWRRSKIRLLLYCTAWRRGSSHVTRHAFFWGHGTAGRGYGASGDFLLLENCFIFLGPSVSPPDTTSVNPIHS